MMTSGWTARFKFFCLYFLSLLLIVGLSLLHASHASAETLTSGVKSAIEAEDWPKLADELADVTRTNPSPVLRLIAGHALLAANQSNASLELFASALDDQSLNLWRDWSANFAAENSGLSGAWYFFGDAQARLQNWEEAVTAFDKALEINPESFMALNAKGIAHHGLGSSVQARKFIARAAKFEPNFADAHASRAVLGLYGGLSNSEKHATAAIAASEDKRPAAYLNAKGLSLFFGKDFEGSVNVLSTIAANSAVGSIAERNAVISDLADAGILDESVRLSAVLDDVNRLGMSLSAQNLSAAYQITSESEGNENRTVIAFGDSGILFSKSEAEGQKKADCKRFCIEINLPQIDIPGVGTFGGGGFRLERENFPPPKPDPPKDEEVEEEIIEEDTKAPAKMVLGPNGIDWGPGIQNPGEEEEDYDDLAGPIRGPDDILGPIFSSFASSPQTLRNVRRAILIDVAEQSNAGDLGGVDSLPPVSHIGTVTPIYGLLYSVPLIPGQIGS